MAISRRTARWKTKKVFPRSQIRTRNRRRRKVILTQGKSIEGVEGESLLIRKGTDGGGRKGLGRRVNLLDEGRGLGVDRNKKEEAQVRNTREGSEAIRGAIQKSEALNNAIVFVECLYFSVLYYLFIF
jgi:hypothetical protein